MDDAYLAQLLERRLEEVATEVWSRIEDHAALLEREIRGLQETVAILTDEQQAETV
jgi:hypothetical protein